MLSASQESVLQYAMQGRNLFITGKAGSGKSFVAAHVQRALGEQGKACHIVTNSNTLNTKKLGFGQVIIISAHEGETTRLKSTGEWGRLNLKSVCCI